MIEIKNVSKNYGKIYANQNINLEIPEASISLLVGPNGAGKSTLIKCIMGLLKYEGEILIDGVINKSEEGRGLIGYVPEIPHIYDLLTVEEHLEFVARVYKLKDYQDLANKLIKVFDLDEHRNKLGSELSKGMQQKLSIICALLPRPKYIIFDEPMIGLDPHGIIVLKKVFAKLKELKVGMLISTHILDTVDEIWDEVCILSKGKLLAVASREQLIEHNESLEDLFFRVTEPESVGDIKLSIDEVDTINQGLE